MKLLLLLLMWGVALLPYTSAVMFIEGKHQLCYANQKDLNIVFFSNSGGIITTNSQLKCGSQVKPSTTVFSHSFLYAIEQVNLRLDLLPNITIGFVLVDSCYHDLSALSNMMYLLPAQNKSDLFPDDMPITCEHGWKNFKVVGTIGPSGSRSAVMIGGLSTIFHIPVVSDYASSDELSDKTRFAYTMRVVPPDRFQAEAIVDFVLDMKWTYISIIVNEGAYGENMAKQVERHGKRKGVCIAFRYMLPSDYTEIDIEEISRKLILYKNARVVITILEAVDMKAFEEVLERKQMATHFIWIGGDWFHYTVQGESSLNSFLAGSFAVNFKGITDKGFRKYLELATPQKYPHDPFLKSIWEQKYDCKWNRALGNKSCFQYESEPSGLKADGGWDSKQIDAVYVYAYALQELITADCPKAFVDKTLLDKCITGDKLYARMLKVEFDGLSGHMKFDSKGDFLGPYDIFQYQGELDNRGANIGIWDKQKATLKIDSQKLNWFRKLGKQSSAGTAVPESVCSKPCHPKEYYIQKELPCCWDCRKCRSNEILVNNKTGCTVCDLFTWPDTETLTKCDPIEPEQLEWTSTLVISIVIVTCCGILVCLLVAGVFIKNREKKLVKASSRQLMVIIQLGIVQAYLTVLFLLLRPSAVSCYLSRFGFNLSVTFIYAPLMVKTNRVYRIFNAGKRGTKSPMLVGSRAQIIIVITMIILQIAVCVTSVIIAAPIPLLRQQVPTEKYVENLCSLPLTGLIPPLSLNLLFISVCAVYGFLTKNLPANFNESWYIFISVATTTFLWMVFLPAYFTAFYAVHQVVLLACCLIFNGTVTLLCLYIPKIYCIYFVDEETVQLQAAGTAGASSVTPGTTITQVTKSEGN